MTSTYVQNVSFCFFNFPKKNHILTVHTWGYLVRVPKTKQNIIDLIFYIFIPKIKNIVAYWNGEIRQNLSHAPLKAKEAATTWTSSKADTKGKNAKNVQVESRVESSSRLDWVCVLSQQEEWSVAQLDATKLCLQNFPSCATQG